MQRFELVVFGDEVSFSERFFITREKGERAYALLKAQLEHVPGGDVMAVVFPPGQVIDGSFADESIIRLGEEIVAGVYGDRGLILQGVTEDSVKNIAAVIGLRRLKLAFLASEPTGLWKWVGHLEPNLAETLEMVAATGCLTAPDLASQKNLAINTASNRLKRLYDQHLVRREHEISNKGLQYIYCFWGRNR